MRNWLIWGAVCLCLLLCFCACSGKDKPGDESESGSDTESVTPAPGENETENVTEGETSEDETETQPAETAPAPELTAEKLVIGDGKVSVSLTLDPNGVELTGGKVVAVLSEGEKEISRAEADAVSGALDVTLTCPAEKQNAAMSLCVEVVKENEVKNVIRLAMKDSLPQLTPDGIRCVVAAMTDEEKAHMVTGLPSPVLEGASGGTYPIPRLGVPSITVNDGPAGVRYGQAVWYPSVSNLSTSWDPALTARVGQAIGEDARALGVDVVLGPGMNIQKNVLGGRSFEYSSEDPILTALMVSAYVNGMQSTGTGACLKHFAVNNQETARGTVSANVTERALREIYLKAFGLAVRLSQPYTVMSSYNGLNGLPTSVNADLLTGILREEFGFSGFVMSDWGAAGSMVDKVNARNDVNMPGNASDPDDVLAALKAGKISRKVLDACCEDILTAVVRCPAFTDPGKSRIDFKGQDALNKEVAPDTLVLLKNQENALPLASGSTLAVFGNGANATIYGGDGSGAVNARTTVSILDAVNKSKELTLFEASSHPFKNAPRHQSDEIVDIPVTQAMADRAAAGADAALIVISRATTEGQDHSVLPGDFRLNQVEEDMIRVVSEAFRKAGKKVTVALNVGNPIEVESWREMADAIILCGYAGQETGDALVKVMTGEVNPSAKLTQTWPVSYLSTPAHHFFPGNASDVTYYEDVYVGYRYYTTFGVDTSFEFGFGLSYTTFAYSDFSAVLNPDGTVTARVTVTNTGKAAGREIVQLYASKPETLQEQAARELIGFGKTALLAPGETETLVITTVPEALETYDTAGSRFVIDKGEYTFSVGASVNDLRGSVKATLADEILLLDVENRCKPDTVFPIIEKATYKVPEPGEELMNLALGKEAWSDYSENDKLTASRAVDGDYVTRWSGLGTPNPTHTWQVDLGGVYEIGRVHISWESISAPFTLWVSTDGKSFVKCFTVMPDGSCSDELNLHGTEARILRVTMPKNGYVSIFEFEAYEATEEDKDYTPEEDPRRNIAQGKPVTSSTHEADHIAAHANDGNLDTRFGALQNDEGWLMVDLEQIHRLGEISIFFEAAWTPYRVEVSTDGENFTTVFEGAKDQKAPVINNLDVNARFIRVVRDGEDWFSIFEIFVYER